MGGEGVVGRTGTSLLHKFIRMCKDESVVRRSCTPGHSRALPCPPPLFFSSIPFLFPRQKIHLFADLRVKRMLLFPQRTEGCRHLISPHLTPPRLRLPQGPRHYTESGQPHPTCLCLKSRNSTEGGTSGPLRRSHERAASRSAVCSEYSVCVCGGG